MHLKEQVSSHFPRLVLVPPPPNHGSKDFYQNIRLLLSHQREHREHFWGFPRRPTLGRRESGQPKGPSLSCTKFYIHPFELGCRSGTDQSDVYIESRFPYDTTKFMSSF